MSLRDNSQCWGATGNGKRCLYTQEGERNFPFFWQKLLFMKIPVLFTAHNSLYNDFDIFDCYDEKRNAFTYTDRVPLIAHPPCRLFSRLRKLSSADPIEKKCAYFALARIRQFGGILEHPRSSTLWLNGNFKLDGSVDDYGGFLRSVNLSWFGFPAQKKTMLYFVGIRPGSLPSFPMSLNAITHVISSSSNTAKKELSALYRSQTPQLMIDYFLEVMAIINDHKKY